MAKKNVRDEPPKTQVTENAQLSDIVFILDKMELLLQAISDIDKNGRYKTVPADKKHRNSFLKIDRYASMFENFLKNFWSQLKDPTRFGILSVKENALDNPEVRQAIEDLAAGRKSDAVEEFLKKYEIVPRSKENQSINHQNQEEMAKKTETQQQAAPETAQQPKYRYNESMINWEELKKYGLSREYLQERGLLDQMLRGYKTNQVVPISMNFGSAVLRTDARLSLQQSVGGPIVLGIHGIRQKPELDRPYFGHIFSEEDKKNLRESGNMGRVADLNLRGNTTEPCLISIDKNTNELVAVRQEHVYIPNEIKGVTLTPDEIQKLKNGEQIFVEGMKSNQGKEFNANLQYSAERRGIEFIFPKDQAFNQQTLGGVPLSPMQLKALNEGHTILVEDMKRKNGELFSSFVTMDKVTGGLQYTRHNPETGEIYIPKEICSVQLTPEDKEALRKGQPIYLENMINRKGEEFSSFVKLDLASGRPQYSRTPDGFNERQAPTIPAEVYGHLLSAQERANLQDGKAILVTGMKGPNGKPFDSYLKVNANTGQLQYFQENPDVRRNTSQRASQTDNTQQQEQKKGAKQAV